MALRTKLRVVMGREYDYHRRRQRFLDTFRDVDASSLGQRNIQECYIRFSLVDQFGGLTGVVRIAYNLHLRDIREQRLQGPQDGR